MKKYVSWLLVAIMSVALLAPDLASAKRLGGGRSLGRQSDSVTRQTPRAPTEAPAAAPAQARPAPASGASRWLGPLAGFAAGGLLASMFMGHGFSGGGFMDILLLGLLVVGGIFLWRMLRRSGRTEERPVQYAGVPRTPSAPSNFAPSGSLSQPPVSQRASLPPGFETEPFLRHAKVSFIRLQAANDAKDLADLRDYSTPEMYGELDMDIQERGSAAQKTEVVSLNAELLGVETEGDLAIASVRFTGLVREREGGSADPIDEVWHVQKSVSDPKSTWLVAGIQQMK